MHYADYAATAAIADTLMPLRCHYACCHAAIVAFSHYITPYGLATRCRRRYASCLRATLTLLMPPSFRHSYYTMAGVRLREYAARVRYCYFIIFTFMVILRSALTITQLSFYYDIFVLRCHIATLWIIRHILLR